MTLRLRWLPTFLLAGAACALAIATCTGVARAQSGSLAGRVASDSGKPMADVEVSVLTAQRSARTDARGTFRIHGLVPGTHIVRVRAPGYTSLTDTVVIVDQVEAPREYELKTRVTSLDSIRVVGRGGEHLSARMRRFEQRRATGIGTFLPPEHLRQNEELTLRSVLARVPGIRFVVYNNQTFASLARGPASPNAPRAIPWDQYSPRRCWVQIYLDGIRIYAPIASVRAPDAGQPVPDIDAYRVRDIEAVEFYSGPAQTPVELGGTGATCGTLVLWTRER